MKNSIITLVKECIATHACIHTENGNIAGLFLDDLAVDHIADDVADALITNGYGDVAEWKCRAEVAERALNYAVSEYRCDECPCIECNAEIRGSQECVNLIAKTYKMQAEREIEEERK